MKQLLRELAKYVNSQALEAVCWEFFCFIHFESLESGGMFNKLFNLYINKEDSMKKIKKFLVVLLLAVLAAGTVLPAGSALAQEEEPRTDWLAIYNEGEHNTAQLSELIPGVYEGFGQMAAAALGEGALTTKEKEYVALAISVAAPCDKCISSHVKNLIELGATRQEIAEVVGVNILMGGGPSSVYAARALQAYDQLVEVFGSDAESSEAAEETNEEEVSEEEAE